MKILLINQSNGVEFNQNPPLGLMYVASALRGRGHVVDIYDQGAMESGHRLPDVEEIRASGAHAVGISLYTFGLPGVLRYLRALRHAIPGIVIVAGGHHATALPERTMTDAPEIDFLVKGEADQSAPDLLDALANGGPVDRIPGLLFRRNGALVFTGARPLIADLDALPFPAHDLIQKYTYPSEGIQAGTRVLNVIGSRGCPFHCTYCNKAVHGSRYRVRSPGNLLDEVEEMFRRYSYDEVNFHDELFTADRRWLSAFFAEMDRRGLRFGWRCLGRVGTVDGAALREMRRRGCTVMAFGVESGNAAVREDIRRRMDDDRIVATFRDAHDAGIVTYAFNMINHRKDTKETIRDTFRLMCRVNAAFSPIFICSPNPGSEIYGLLPESVKYDWERFNSYRDFRARPISICAVAEEDLMLFSRQMESMYYRRWAYVARNGLRRGIPWPLRKLILKVWLYHLLVFSVPHLARDTDWVTGNAAPSWKRAFFRVVDAIERNLLVVLRKARAWCDRGARGAASVFPPASPGLFPGDGASPAAGGKRS